MADHDFNFDGGHFLKKIGSTFFVSYLYYSYVDENHVAWQNLRSVSIRLSFLNHYSDYHSCWLREILEMDDEKLETNEIELTGNQVKSMAREILEKLESLRTN